MLLNLFLGLLVMVLCLGLQIGLLTATITYYQRQGSVLEHPDGWTAFRVIGNVMLLLVLGNLVQIAIWAFLFLRLGEFADFAAAFYHSAVNFATLGYGDVVMSERHRLLGPLESVNGILMIGLSSSALMAMLQKVFRRVVRERGGHD